MRAGCNWSVVAEYLPPLLLNLRRWQHWRWEAPCPGSCWVEPGVHPGSQPRNHKLIYLPCLYCSLYMRLSSAKSECSPGFLVGFVIHRNVTHGSATVQHDWPHCSPGQRWAATMANCLTHLSLEKVVDIQSNWLLKFNSQNKYGGMCVCFFFKRLITDRHTTQKVKSLT